MRLLMTLWIALATWAPTLAFAEEEALNKIYLEVRHSNRGAIALYKEMGFHPIGVRKNYYRNQDQYEDALVFEKTITKDNG